MNASPHPRFGTRLQRMEGPVGAFEAALGSGRLHHAWLLTGPQGVGKAHFAYRAARRLLGDGPAAWEGEGTVGAAARLIAARSHPDLLVLEREVEEGPARRNIPVDEARRMAEFFSKAPAIAPYRAAIIDAADDLNVNAANAVLKTLEEPSGRGVVLLVSHSPGRLLPTIRSRCRRLAFPPWPTEALAALAAEKGVGEGADRPIAEIAHGSPGRLMALWGRSGPDLDGLAADLAEGRLDRHAALELTARLKGTEGSQTFSLFIERLGEVIRHRLLVSPSGGAAQAWAEVWRRLSQLPGRMEALNLDREDAFWTVFAEINALTRRGAASEP